MRKVRENRLTRKPIGLSVLRFGVVEAGGRWAGLQLLETRL